MTDNKIIKRNGELVNFDKAKIINAIILASQRTEKGIDEELTQKIADSIEKNLKKKTHIEQIESWVEDRLMSSSRKDIAREYIGYRRNKQIERAKVNDIVHNYTDIIEVNNPEILKENGNLNGDSLSGQKTKVQTENDKWYALNFVLPKYISKAHTDRYIHIHDLDWLQYGMHNCFGRETKFITSKGIKSFYDFKHGDVIEVLTHTGEWKKATVRNYGVQKLNTITFTRLGKTETVRATSDHRWILKDGENTTQLKTGDVLLKPPSIFKFDFNTASESEKNYWCMGFACGDGTIVKNKKKENYATRIRLCGNKNKYKNRFESVGYSTSDEEVWSDGDNMIYMIGYHKTIPEIKNMKVTEIQAFIHGLYDADGSKGDRKSIQFSDVGLIDFVNNYFEISGLYFGNQQDFTVKETNYAVRKETKRFEFISNPRFYWRVTDITPNEYEEVWCLDVEDNHSFVLSKGIVTGNCTQIDLPEVLSRGFSTGNGSVRKANSIQTAFALVAIIMQSVQNCQYGGVGGASVDLALAPFVRTSFAKNFKIGLEYFDEYFYNNDSEIYMTNLKLEELCPKSFKYAAQETIKQTKQGAESLIHNLNTMNSRSGGQVPFTSLNYGLDTSAEGRLIVESLLNATMSGLGNHETPVFPIQIFTCKKGVNQNKEDPNYDLFKLAIECSSKRLFPNFCNVDAPYNAKFYDPSDYRTAVVTMGCRTRVIADRFGKNRVTGKGNLAFTSLNLPSIALESDSLEEFKTNIEKYMDIAKDSLLFRYRLICKNPSKAFDFIMREGIWENGELLNPNESAEELFKHGSLSIGFVGLAEALKALIGEHHGESKEAQSIGVDVIKFMRSLTDKYSDDYNLNFSLFATPAESLAGSLGRHNQKKYGILEGITDREYITNSSHVPVYYNISVKDKIDIEAPYHELCNAGHIGYIELDGNARNNLDAFENIVKYALEKNMTYFSINHPVDFCPNCKYEGIIGKECPNCHTTEEETNFMRWRRLTGYLTGTLDRFNAGKKAEEKDRVKHQ